MKKILRKLSALSNGGINRLKLMQDWRPVTIITYHSVSELPGPYSVSNSIFFRQIEYINNHYSVISLDELTYLFSIPCDGIRRIVITFDDAFGDFIENAFPILHERKLPSAVFVPTGYIGKTNIWDIEHKNIRQRPIMTIDQLQTLAETDLVCIGSHSVDHINLAKQKLAGIRYQIMESKKALENILKREVKYFAYPYGQLNCYNNETGKCLKESGFNLGFTTHWGCFQDIRNSLALKRICLGEIEDEQELETMIEGNDDWIGIKEKAVYKWRKLSNTS